MNKDNLLFTLLGLVLGFVTGWLMFEKIALRQPPRLTQDQLAAVMSGAPVPGPNSTPSAPTGAAPQAGMQAAPGPGQIDTSKLDALQAQLQQNPENPELILAVANESFDIASQAGKAPFVWQQARDHYLKYLSLKDPNPDVLSDLGVTYRELGQFEDALKIFRQAEKMAPEHWQSQYNQVIVLAFDLQQYDKAQSILDDLQKQHPDNQDIRQLAEAVAQRRSAA